MGSSAAPGVAGSNPEAILSSSPTSLLELDFTAFQNLLQDLRGTPVVVNVWASWCGPCRQEAPVLAAAARRYGGRVQFLGIDVRDTRTDGAAFVREAGWTYPSISDPTGELHDRLGLLGQPVTLFYDRTGALVDTNVGPVTAGDLQRRLQALVRQGAAA